MYYVEDFWMKFTFSYSPSFTLLNENALSFTLNCFQLVGQRTRMFPGFQRIDILGDNSIMGRPILGRRKATRFIIWKLLNLSQYICKYNV